MTKKLKRAPRSVGRRIATVLGIIAAVLTVGFVATLAVPVDEWRSGDQGLLPLALHAPQPIAPQIRRLWIDTDAACGAGRRTDPDDCLAIALLLQSARFDVVGVSTTFGNAALPVVDATVAGLLANADGSTGRRMPHYGGASKAMDAKVTGSTAASTALARALESGPLVILALGPLTNVAEVLRAQPQHAAHVARLVAVMGRRPGHLFHPAAGVSARTFFGHGPVMRDFNFAMDEAAAAAILASGVPLSLVPYDAATDIEVTAGDLDRLASTGAAMRWATEHSRVWLDYWTQDIGRRGFFPFDLVAAAYLVVPAAFGCADVVAHVGADDRLFTPLYRPQALLVTDERTDARRHVEYCADAKPDLIENVIAKARE